MAIVICMRHPDYENEFKVFGTPEPLIIDVDYGRLDLTNKVEFSEWRASLILQLRSLQISGTDEGKAAADYLTYIVAQAEEEFGHQEVE